MTEFNESQFFHLHDINSDGFLDRQEIRLLLITELNQEYKEENEVQYTYLLMYRRFNKYVQDCKTFAAEIWDYNTTLNERGYRLISN